MRVLLFILLLSACCPKVTPITHTEVKTDTAYITQKVNIPGDSVRIYIPLEKLCDTVYRFKTIYANTDRTGASAQIVRDTLIIQANCKELQIQVDSLVQITKEVNTTETKIIEQCTSIAHRFYKTAFWILTAIILTLIYFKK